jgi:putative spermidine/putrescine transport system permease protein
VDLALLAPGLGYLLIFMGVPLAQVALRGVGLLRLGEASRFTLAFYQTVLGDKIYRDSIVFTLTFAVVTTVLTLALALVLSALLQVKFPGRYLISVLFKVPLVVPSLVAAFLVLTLIDQGAIIARLVGRYGMEWPDIVHDRRATGMIMVLVWHNVPIMIVILTAIMSAIPTDVLDAARNLGATPWQVFRTITVPLSLSGISAAALLVFINVFGAFSIPSLMGPPYPSALAVLMSGAVVERGEWELASALGTLMAAAAAIILYGYYRLVRRQEAALR